MNIDMTSSGPTGPEEKLRVAVADNSMAALVQALADAKVASNDALTRRVEQYDAVGGSQRGDLAPEDMEQDPSDDSVDPLDEGLERIAAAATVQSPPPKKAKERDELQDGAPPSARLAAVAAALGVSVHGRAFAEAMDMRDPLAPFRGEFCIPKRPGSNQPGLYFVGNSLGLMPKAVRARINEELDAWETRGVEGHFTGARPWAHADEFVRPQVARIVGALPAEVAVMNGLTTNLHLMMIPFYRPTKTRYRIMLEAKSFPSDRFAVESQVRLHGLDPRDAIVEVGPRAGEITLRTEDILRAIEDNKDSLALLTFSGVQYYSGQFFDVARITAAGRAAGAIVGWDMAHAVGNVLLQLHDWDVDWAVWCSYKYLNSGAGGIGGAFVHQRHHNRPELTRLGGWWGHNWAMRFQMDQPWDPIGDANGFRLSNPPILQIAAHLASVDIFDRATMPALRAKSELLTGYLLELLQAELVPSGVVSVITPLDHTQRGCQLSLLWAVDVDVAMDLLSDKGVFVDVRRPSVTRVAPAPLYNSFVDVWDLVQVMKSVVAEAALLASKK